MQAKYIQLIIILFSIAFVKAKCDTINIVNSHHNFLYIGIDNKLHVETETAGYSDLFIESDNGAVFKTEDCFVAIPSKKGKTKLTVYKGEDKKHKIMEESFLTLFIPAPVLTINEKKMDNIKEVDKQFLYQSDSLGIYFTNDIVNVDSWYDISGYSLGYVYGNHYLSYDYDGKKICKEAKEAIQKIPQGHEIIIRLELSTEWDLSIKGPVFRAKVY
jgi:hypothetical protein